MDDDEEDRLDTEEGIIQRPRCDERLMSVLCKHTITFGTCISYKYSNCFHVCVPCGDTPLAVSMQCLLVCVNHYGRERNTKQE